MSAAQSFRFARIRRVRTGAAANGSDSGSPEAPEQRRSPRRPITTVELPAQPGRVQPVLLAGLATTEAATVTTVSGAAIGPVQLSERTRRRQPTESIPVILERRSRPRNGRSVRGLNVCFASLLLIVFAPIMLLIAIAIRLTSRGPVIYKQVRVGRDRRRYDVLSPADRRQTADRRQGAHGRRLARRQNGATARDRSRQAEEDRRMYARVASIERRTGTERRGRAESSDQRRGRIVNAVHDRRVWNTCGETFTMYKFRTMRVDAEAHSGAVWAQRRDPRVTSVGRVLRACRLDELPQLYNVLKGDMNIVGPRPERPTIIPELVESIAYYPIRQRTRPGITGLAQIRHTYDASIDDVRAKVSYDLQYLRRRSVLHDLRIMVQTPIVMFFKRTGH
jgi:lipopolysaccharide/colanic/teichoic acid biosynthesis glycosyltransferase